DGDAGSIANGWSLAITTVTPVNPLADLKLSGLISSSSVTVGASLTNTFTITNSGPNDATGVMLTNVLSAGTTLLGQTSSQGSVNVSGSNVVFSLGTLNLGATATATVYYSADAA